MVLNCRHLSSKRNENMQSQINWLTERVRLLTKQQFGSSSEKRIGEDFRNQLSMCFNEAELTEDTSAAEEKITVREYTKKCRSGSVENVIPEGTPVETIEHRLSEEERTCDVRRTLVILPPPVFVREERFYTCACRKCDKKNDHTPMKQARVPAVLPGSFAPPEATAHIMTQKFVMHSPLYRRAQELPYTGECSCRGGLHGTCETEVHHGAGSRSERQTKEFSRRKSAGFHREEEMG